MVAFQYISYLIPVCCYFCDLWPFDTNLISSSLGQISAKLRPNTDKFGSLLTATFFSIFLLKITLIKWFKSNATDISFIHTDVTQWLEFKFELPSIWPPIAWRKKTLVYAVWDALQQSSSSSMWLSFHWPHHHQWMSSPARLRGPQFQQRGGRSGHLLWMKQ